MWYEHLLHFLHLGESPSTVMIMYDIMCVIMCDAIDQLMSYMIQWYLDNIMYNIII
jgi:hypothetical protein